MKTESAPCGPGVMNAKSGSVKQGVERPFPIGESESPAPSQERGADFPSDMANTPNQVAPVTGQQSGEAPLNSRAGRI